MSEQLLPQPDSQAEADPSLTAQAAFETRKQEQAQMVPEVAQRPEIMEAGKELISEFSIKPSLFESADRSMVFTAIASTWAEHRNGTDEAAYKGKNFVANSLALLAHKHSDALTDISDQLKEEDGHVDDETAVRVYDKYTDRQLSEAVKQKVADGYLDGTKERLGITAENEDPYEIRVLSIADNSQLFGLEAPKPDYDLPFNHPDYQNALKLNDAVRKWSKELEQRGDDMAKELGTEGMFGPAWVTALNGKRTLCISSALAEKIVDPEVISNSNWYGKDDLARDVAVFAHEYTHTQGGLMVDREVQFGINLEERRAEYYSGDKQGYQDIKGLLIDYKGITGHDILNEFDERPKGGTAAEVYGSIANKIGLSNMLMLIQAAPNNYASNQTNSLAKEIRSYTGGFDGIERKLLEQEIAKGNADAIEKRLTLAAARIVEIEARSEDFSSFWIGYRRNFGLNTFTDLMEQKIAALKAEAAATTEK